LTKIGQMQGQGTEKNVTGVAKQGESRNELKRGSLEEKSTSAKEKKGAGDEEKKRNQSKETAFSRNDVGKTSFATRKERLIKGGGTKKRDRKADGAKKKIRRPMSR